MLPGLSSALMSAMLEAVLRPICISDFWCAPAWPLWTSPHLLRRPAFAEAFVESAKCHG